jgi:hemerythrin-like domain-containing protein
VVTPLRDLIRSHIDEEERTIFPELRRQLGESALPRVSGQISREEALVI